MCILSMREIFNNIVQFKINAFLFLNFKFLDNMIVHFPIENVKKIFLLKFSFKWFPGSLQNVQ